MIDYITIIIIMTIITIENEWRNISRIEKNMLKFF